MGPLPAALDNKQEFKMRDLHPWGDVPEVMA